MTGAMQTDLHAPLLGDEEVSCCCRQEYDDAHFVKNESTRHHPHHHDHDMMMAEDDINDTTDNTTSFCCNDTVIIWIILPGLLLSQFGMAFALHDERTAHLSWHICNFSIFLFCVTGWLFRHACVDARLEQPVVLLLAPEICMDIILALVLFNQVELGFIAMLASMLVLSGFVVVTTAHFLYCRDDDMEPDEEEDEEEEFQPEKEENKISMMTQACIV
jgi:hypothetical protein